MRVSCRSAGDARPVLLRVFAGSVSRGANGEKLLPERGTEAAWVGVNRCHGPITKLLRPKNINGSLPTFGENQASLRPT